MVPRLIVWTLVAACGAASLAAASDVGLRQPKLRNRMMADGLMVSTDDSSVATARIALDRVREPGANPYAVYMSVGPRGAWVPEPPVRLGGMAISVGPSHRRLRVTISTCERTVLLFIDEILTGRADSRSLTAQYRISPYFDYRTRGLWEALRGAPRVRGAESEGPPITWLSPTAFSWTTVADTLLFEQQADSIFQMTVRPRLR